MAGSSTHGMGLSLSCERAGDAGCPLVRQGGERLSACATKATQPFERQLSLLTRSVTRPSLGPRARARRSSLTSPVKAVEGGALDGGSRLGKPGNRRNQHRHLVAVDEARLDAHSDSRKRDQGMRQKRMEVAAFLPSRITRVPVGVPARRKCSCRSRLRRHLVSNKLTCSTLQKGTRRE